MDRYTKVVLTVITLALLVQVGQNFTRPAQAQFGPCGTYSNPCVITQEMYPMSRGALPGKIPLLVTVEK